MKGHQLYFEDFKGSPVEMLIGASIGKDGGKSLSVRVILGGDTIEYVVCDKKVPVYEGNSLEAAVDLYNLL